MVQAQKVRPANEFRLGRIKTTIWANSTTTGELWFNVEIVRLYLEGDQWHESRSFGRDDLPLVSKAAEMAFAWIWSESRQAFSGQPDLTAPENNE